MKQQFLLSLFVFISFVAKSQKVEAIYFNLYTDSLKKGVQNYINVDGKLTNGKYIPLDDSHIQFSSNAGKWLGNNLILDSSYKQDSVLVTASLKSDSTIKKSVVIYLKMNLVTERLKTEQEVINEINNPNPKRKKN